MNKRRQRKPKINRSCPSGLEEMIADANQALLLMDAFGEAQWRAFCAGSVDRHLVAEIHHRGESHKRHIRLHGQPEFKVPRLTDGPVTLGTSVGHPRTRLQVPMSVFEGNILTIAGSGAGTAAWRRSPGVRRAGR